MLDDLEALKRDVETARRRRDQAEGERTAALRSLAKEFNCPTVAAARKLLAELEEAERAAAVAYTAARAEFDRLFTAVRRTSG